MDDDISSDDSGADTAAAKRTGLVNSVLRACDVVGFLADHGPDVPLAQVADGTGLTRPTAHRILKTLEQAGWVRTTEGRYTLTMRVFAIGSLASRGNSLQAIARPLMTALAADTASTAYLYIPLDNKALCIDRVEPAHPVRVHHVNVGDSLDLSSGAAPLLLAALRPDLASAAGLDGGSRDLTAALAAARSNGYVVRHDDVYPGITAIAAAVRGADAHVVATIGIAGLSETLAGAAEDTARESVLRTAASISTALGFNR
ncbi:IclR family transcriptional regulator [Mycolicibacterium sp.]|uniref:IclR family transcriptional regulator n=1 Tax=Mycolicibacterium sp. TaxID=2320850 RepID=UPI003D13A1B5